MAVHYHTSRADAEGAAGEITRAGGELLRSADLGRVAKLMRSLPPWRNVSAAWTFW
jgi:hypothetical protein